MAKENIPIAALSDKTQLEKLPEVCPEEDECRPGSWSSRVGSRAKLIHGYSYCCGIDTYDINTKREREREREREKNLSIYIYFCIYVNLSLYFFWYWYYEQSYPCSGCTVRGYPENTRFRAGECFHPWIRTLPKCHSSQLLDDGWLTWWWEC